MNPLLALLFYALPSHCLTTNSHPIICDAKTSYSSSSFFIGQHSAPLHPPRLHHQSRSATYCSRRPPFSLLAPSGTRSIRRDTRESSGSKPIHRRRPNGRKRHQRRPPSFSLSHDSPASYKQLLYSIRAATVPRARYPSAGLRRISPQPCDAALFSALGHCRALLLFSSVLFPPCSFQGKDANPHRPAALDKLSCPLPDAADKGYLPSAR